MCFLPLIKTVKKYFRKKMLYSIKIHIALKWENKNSTKAFDENIWFNQLPSRYFYFIFKSVPINLLQNVGGCFT